VAWHPQLAHDDDAERHLERPGHFEGHRHTPARQTQNDNVRPASVSQEPLGQTLTRFGTVSEWSRHHFLVI